MKLKACSIYDKRAQAYGPPMCYPTLGVAERSFSDAVNDAGTTLHKHPEDYQLYELGEFDTETGEYTQKPARVLCEAWQFKQDFTSV